MPDIDPQKLAEGITEAVTEATEETATATEEIKEAVAEAVTEAVEEAQEAAELDRVQIQLAEIRGLIENMAPTMGESLAALHERLDIIEGRIEGLSMATAIVAEEVAEVIEEEAEEAEEAEAVEGAVLIPEAAAIPTEEQIEGQPEARAKSRHFI